METTETNEAQIPAQPKGVLLLDDALSFLYEAGKWARFLGIIGFIFSALIALMGLFFGAIFSSIAKYQPTPMPIPFAGAMGAFMGVIYILIAILYFFLSRYLYRFGTRAGKGAEFKDAAQLTSGLASLKSFFKINGILVIIFLSLYVLIIIGAIAFGAMMHR